VVKQKEMDDEVLLWIEESPNDITSNCL